MRLFSAVLAAVTLLPISVLAAPAGSVELKSIIKHEGPTSPDSYIVKLKDDVSKTNHLAWLDANHNTTGNVTYRNWQTSVFHGYAGMFNADTLDALRASPDVDYIEEDGIMQTEATAFTVVQRNTTWGLQRISQDPKLPGGSNPNSLIYNYTYDNSAGEGVDVYVIDTGIYLGHNEFGGRAIWGATFGPYADQDGNGHGTHVAGTIGGTRFGVSKNARLVAVKVLSDSGSGALSDIIAGIDYVASVAPTTGRPSVANLSLGGPGTTSLDSAVAALVVKGVHTVVAAGNSNANASNYSPAREPTVITVGATDIADERASFSNWGAVVDIFAPGVTIISAGIAGQDSIAVKSGTSMAAPHVAGIIGTYISHLGNLSPAGMTARLISYSLKGVISDIPAGTPNRLARNEV